MGKNNLRQRAYLKKFKNIWYKIIDFLHYTGLPSSNFTKVPLSASIRVRSTNKLHFVVRTLEMVDQRYFVVVGEKSFNT